MKHTFTLLSLVPLIGCSTNDIYDSAQVSSHVSTLVATESAYGSSLALGVVPTAFAEEVTWGGLQGRIQPKYDQTFPTVDCRYIGQKNGYNYFVISSFFESREFLKISLESHQIKDPFDLTTDQNKWVKVYSSSVYSLQQNVNLAPIGDGQIFYIQGNQGFRFDYANIDQHDFPLEELKAEPVERGQ